MPSSPVDDADRAALVARLRAAGCVFAEDEAEVLLAAAPDPVMLERLVARRVAGAALEHLVGWVDFAGLRLEVAPGVFVPRQRSVRIARATARLAAEVARRGADRRGHDVRPVVVELCCGAGPIAAVVADRVPTARLVVADIDPVALAVAARTVPSAAAHLGAGFGALPAAFLGRIDVAAAVPPYVPERERDLLPHDTLAQEPTLALLGGDDGLDVARDLIAEAPRWLAPGGRLLLELGRGQLAAAARSARAVGLVVHRRAVVDGQTALLDAERRA